MAKLIETDLTMPVLRVLRDAPGGMMPMADIKDELESILTLSAADLAPSTSRSPEPVWRQIAGNITSHRNDEGNLIAEGLAEYVSKSDGLRITEAGRNFLAKHGY